LAYDKGKSIMDHQPIGQKDLKQLLTYLQNLDQTGFRAMIQKLHSYDLARLFFQLSNIYQRRLLTLLQPEEIALLMEELDLQEQKEVLAALGQKKAAQVLDHMPNDDAADLLSELELSQSTLLLKEMKTVEADQVRALLHYPEDTAGGLMTNAYVQIFSHYTVEETLRFLREITPAAETIYYLYVTDVRHRLIGVLSLRDLLIREPHEKIDRIMNERVISVPVDMDQEEVARILSRYDFLALPVVDQNKKLVGIVTVDDIIDVLIEEAREDLEQLSAVQPTDFVDPFDSARKRIPWLIILLGIGILTANLIGLFESTIEVLPVLTLFMPMVAGMTGNAATQSLALTIRALSKDQPAPDHFRKFIRQEGIAGVIIGLICSVFITLAIGIWKSFQLGLVVGLSLFFTLILGTMVGTFVPLILEKFGIDPTTASGPLITTLNDVFSLMIYFGFATLFLQYLM
jgi:magnesium transporter